MKKIIISFAIYLVIMGVTNSFAEPLQMQIQMQMHAWEVVAEISHITYEEPDVMKEKGFMYGIAGSYAYHNNLMLKTGGKFSYGQVDYENTGTIDNIDNYMIELRLLGGYDFPVFAASILTPYVGFGYRYLNDDSGGMISSTGASGYERESNYYYSPIGIETLTKLENEWHIGVILEYDYFWKGKQISHLGNALPGVGNIENDQNDGYGLRGSVKFRKNGKWVYIIEPFIRYWNIGKSEIDNGWFEPKNNSTEIGFKLSVRL